MGKNTLHRGRHYTCRHLKIKKDKIIFLFFNQFIMIEFYNKAKFVRDNPEFEIRTHFNPFYLE